MKDILTAPFVTEMRDITANMYRMGWDERNGGNISYRLDEQAVAEYLDLNDIKRVTPLNFDASAIKGEYFIVTASGGYFRNVLPNPADNLGVLRVSEDGQHYELLWGYENGSKPTSELPTHLMNHIARLAVDPEHRIVMHAHPVNALAMTFVHNMDDKAFTKTLWQMCTECIVVFPEGVAVLPWMVCGNNEIGEETAKKIKDVRVVLWGQHGMFCTGKDMDETFGLAETVEKAAEVYIKIMGMPILQSITDEELQQLADAFGITPRAGYLS